MNAYYGIVIRCGLIAALLIAPTISVRAQVAQLQVQIDVATITCIDEEDELTNDEPYLIIVPFFADGTTVRFGKLKNKMTVALPGSHPTVMTVAKTQDNIRNGDDWCQEGQTYSVPINTGRFIHPIAPISPEVLDLGGTVAATIGLVVVVMEEDSSPRVATDAARDAMVSVLQRELELAIFRQTQKPEEILFEVRQAAQRAAMARTLGPFNLAGVLGPDDVIEVKFITLSLFDLALRGSAGMPFNMHFGIFLPLANGKFDPPNGEYLVSGLITLGPVLPALPPHLTLTVRRVHALGGFGEAADFYAKLNIGGVESRTAFVDDRDDITPFWNLTASPIGDVVPVDIEIWDRDGSFNGNDDPVDISPAAGEPLHLSVNQRTGEIFENGRRLGRIGDTIRVAGSGNNERALVDFSLTFPQIPRPESEAHQACVLRCSQAFTRCMNNRIGGRPLPSQCASSRRRCSDLCPAR